MSLQRFISNSAALLLWGIALVAAGCSEDVNPVVGIDYPYTLYGYMNPEADTQWVRVFPIGHTLEATDSGPLHARFKSINAMTGEAEV